MEAVLISGFILMEKPMTWADLCKLGLSPHPERELTPKR